jgi:GT2 family glycosyltransferase
MQAAESDVACLTNRFYGHGFLFERALLGELEGFRDPFGYSMEEIEISLRLLDRGYRIVYEPGATVVHHEDPRGRDLHRIGRLRFRNGILVVLLTYPAWAVGPGCLRSIQNVLRFTPGLGFSGMVGAMRDVLKLLPYVRSHRDAVTTSTLFEYSSLGRRPRVL